MTLYSTDPNGADVGVGSDEIQDYLENGPRVLDSGRHLIAKDDTHPYRLVVLNCCEAYSESWAQAFGIPYSAHITPDLETDYIGRNQMPRAFVGWTDAIIIPSGTGALKHLLQALLGTQDTVEMQKYADCLGAFFDDWMSDRPLADCMLHFTGYARTEYGYELGNYGISGCKDLKRVPR